jgi:hypothetical protein
VSLVGRGLGRKTNDAALLVSAGLGRSGIPAPEPESPSLGGGPDAPRRRTDYDDDELINMALAIIMSGALDG